MNYKTLSVLSVSALMFVNVQVHAEIFKCVNVQAEVYYNDRPCPVTQIERKVKAVKAPKNGYKPPAFVEKAGVKNSQGVIVGGVSGKEINSSQNSGGEKPQNGNKSTQDSDSSQDYGANPSAKPQGSIKVSDSRIANTIEDRMHRERMKLKRMQRTQ